jgi:hypothetical protein
VDRVMREVAGALGSHQDQCVAAIGHEAPLQQAKRVNDYPRVPYIPKSDRLLMGTARDFPAAV